MTDPEDIRNFLRLSDRVTTSGRLEEQDPARLKAIGVRHVINLAMEDHPEALPDAAASMAQQGLHYTHIPVPFDAPSDEHFQAFVKALEGSDEPVHVHCIMNFRVSAFFYRYHVQIIGINETRARGIMEKIWAPHDTEEPAFLPWKAFAENAAR